MFITEQIRERDGQYALASDSYMMAIGKERMGRCTVCGHEIKLHVGVVNSAGEAMWVGSNCAHILTKGDAPAAVYTPEGIKEYIVPSGEWVAALRDAAYINFKRLFIRNDFLVSLYRCYEQRGRLTVKQYNAANKLMTA